MPMEWLVILSADQNWCTLYDLKYKYTVKDTYDALEMLEGISLIKQEIGKSQDANR